MMPQGSPEGTVNLIQAAETLHDTWFAYFFLPFRQDDVIRQSGEQILPTLFARGLWVSVGRILRRGLLTSQQCRWAVEQASLHARDDDFLHFFFDHCAEDQLALVINNLVQRRLWWAVGSVLNRIGYELRAWALQEAMRLADAPSFAMFIFFRCNLAELRQARIIREDEERQAQVLAAGRHTEAEDTGILNVPRDEASLDDQQEAEDEDQSAEYSDSLLDIEKIVLEPWRTRYDADEMDGWTSLHLACYYNRVHDVRSLVEVEQVEDHQKERIEIADDTLPLGDQKAEDGGTETKTQDQAGNKPVEVSDSTDDNNMETENDEETETQPTEESDGTATGLLESKDDSKNDSNSMKPIMYVNRPSPINERTEDGETPLFVACQRGHVTVVKLLLTLKGGCQRAK